VFKYICLRWLLVTVNTLETKRQNINIIENNLNFKELHAPASLPPGKELLVPTG